MLILNYIKKTTTVIITTTKCRTFLMKIEEKKTENLN